jgi:hypothetical protein
MTESGKYDYMKDNIPAGSKEWSLKRELDDAEMLI